jgi:heptosyltransferase-3
MFNPAPHDAIDPQAVRRVLVIKLRHHGDVLLTSPVLSALKASLPHATIDALVYADTAPMLALHPALNTLFTIDRAWKKSGVLHQARAEWALFSALRACRHDLVVHLTDHPRGAWLARLLKPRWSVAPTRAGSRWGKSFTHLYPGALRGRHTVEANLDALRRLGLTPPAVRRLTLTPGPAADARIAALRAEHGFAESPFLVLHPSSRWFFKCWPVSRNAELLHTLAGRGHTLVITAAPDAKEREMVRAILDEAKVPVIDLSGMLSLKELAALISQARLFIGVDSAPMHIAAAMGTPCVALFGPSGEAEWAPFGVAHEVISSDQHPCRPCGRDGCGGGKVSECLTTLPVARVLAAVDRLLER